MSITQSDYYDKREDGIRWVVNVIVEQFDPEKIILFGSYAYGKPERGSDVDLLIILNTDLPPRVKRREISSALSPHPFGMDLIIRTPAQMEHRLTEGDFFLREIMSKGKVLYEKPYKRVDRQSRK